MQMGDLNVFLLSVGHWPVQHVLMRDRRPYGWAKFLFGAKRSIKGGKKNVYESSQSSTR